MWWRRAWLLVEEWWSGCCALLEGETAFACTNIRAATSPRTSHHLWARALRGLRVYMVAPDLRFRVNAGDASVPTDSKLAADAKSQSFHVMPAEPAKPRGITGHVLYFVQDLVLTNLHWMWLTCLIGSLVIYGIFSRAFLRNLAFTLLPHLIPGSSKRRLHHA